MMPETIPGLVENQPAFGQLDPNSALDTPSIEKLAATAQIPLMERRMKCRQLHGRKARQQSIELGARVKADVQSKQVQLEQRQAHLSQAQKALEDTPRLVRSSDGSHEREPATAFEYSKFFGTLLLKLGLIVTGAFSISMAMLANPDFTGETTKVAALAGSIILLPAWALSFPISFFKEHLTGIKIYMTSLLLSGMGCGAVFVVTWAWLNGGNDFEIVLDSIASIGLETSSESQPWILENAKFVNLASQVLTDILLAGCATCYMYYLSLIHDLFRPSARRTNPEYLILEQEVRGEELAVVNLSAALVRAEEHLVEVERQEEEFVDTVCAIADAQFLREVDRFQLHRQQLEAINGEVAAQAEALRTVQEKRERYLTTNPGLQIDGHYSSTGDTEDAAFN